MSKREELLEKYDRADQGTKREIINYLCENPDQEHRPENVFEEIQNESTAGTVDTVANNLSELATEGEITHVERSFYQWPGRGNPDPNRRLRVVEESFREWFESLVDSQFAFLIFFVLIATGILAGMFGLMFLFMPWDSFFGLEFMHIFFLTGLATTLASATLLMWTFVYYVEVFL